MTSIEQTVADAGIPQDHAKQWNQGQPTGIGQQSRQVDRSARELQRRADAELLERILTEHLRTGYLGAAVPAEDNSQNTCWAPYKRSTDAPRLDRVPCPEYQVLASRLVGYAMPVFKDWLRTGKIKKELLGRHLPHTLTSDDYLRLHTSMAARDALAVAVVIAGEEYFRRNVIPNRKWRADGKASLETYFVVGCLYQFAIAVRAWKQEHPEWSEARLNSDFLIDEIGFPAGSAISTPDEVAGNRDLIRYLIQIAPPLVGRIMLGIFEGYTFMEIGEQVGLSARAVEGRMHRFRTQLKDDSRRGRLEVPPGLIQHRAVA
jgi:hypothetical protein